MYRHQSDGKINDVRGWGSRPLYTSLADQYWRKEANTVSSYTDIGTQISDQSLNSQSWLRREKIRIAAGLPTRKVDYNFLRKILGVSMSKNRRRNQEKFASSELREAVFKLRKQVKHLKIEIKDKNWLQTLRDLGDIESLDEEFLKSLYILRNCYQRNFFTKEVKEVEVPVIDDTDQLHAADEVFSDSCSIPSSDDALAYRMDPSRHFLQNSQVITRLRTLSNDSSVMTGGGSPAVVRKRPNKPQFFLSLDNFRDHDDLMPESCQLNFDVQRKDSESSDGILNYERANSLDSDTSYLNVTEDQSVSSRSNSMEKQSISISRDAEVSKNEACNHEKRSHLCQACFKLNKNCLKPGSPTAELLSPIFDAEDCSDLQNAVDNVYQPMSISLSRLRSFEQELKLLPVLQVKLAVLQEEKRQLMNMLKHQRKHKPLCHSLSNGSSPLHSGRSSPSFCMGSDGDSIKLGNSVSPVLDDHVKPHNSLSFEKELHVADSGVASDLSDRACIDMGTQIMFLTESSGQQTDSVSVYDVTTWTEPVKHATKGVGNDIAERFYQDVAVQRSILHAECNSQTDTAALRDTEVMHGSGFGDLRSRGVQVLPDTRDRGIGNEVAEIFLLDKETECVCETKDSAVSAVTSTCNASANAGCSVYDLEDACVGDSLQYRDFSCGEGVAELVHLDRQTEASPLMIPQYTSTENMPVAHTATSCEILCFKETRTIGIGSNTVCDSPEKSKTKSTGVGCYNTVGPRLHYCAVDDKLCSCVKPKSKSVGTGPNVAFEALCERCQNTKTKSIGVGKDRIDDLLCDRCLYVRLRTVAVGDDKVDDPLCIRCRRKGKCLSIGVGDEFVAPAGALTDAEVQTEDLQLQPKYGPGRNFSTSSEEDLCREISDILGHDNNTKHTPCKYCGSQVAVPNERRGGSLLPAGGKPYEIRKISQNSLYSEYEKCTAKTEMTEITEETRNGNRPPSPEEEEEEDDAALKKKSDIIEICKLLQDHFSGRKHLKQQQMVVFMASIETLWFKTVRKKRAKPAVVQGYLDLFVSRIPELLQTIVNLADSDGNTSLHYALTYKNYAMVNVLLDTGACNIHVVNKAGYTPVMLAALVGFDSKKDKYVVQRLLSVADLNVKSVETGQTALMLAVTRGNTSMVELIMDAGADVNEVDDDGSTALMCACEIGNINIVKLLLSSPECDATKEDNDGSTALSIAMDSRRKDLALLIYGSMNFDARGRIKLSPSKQSLLGLGSRRSPSPVIGRT